MVAQTNKRKNYFIDKKFQSNFILRFCGLVILGSIISGIILYFFSRSTVTTAFVNSRLSIVSTADYILPALIGSSLITILLIGIATAVVVMYQSHRIAGPLFNIQRSARKIGDGDLTTKITLRSTDEMIKLADCFNEMTENINSHIAEIKAKSRELDSVLMSFRGEKIQEELERLSKKKAELDKVIDYFKV